MNGRVYDATLARFVSADPHIQAGSLSQSYNRYSYVLNNPLKYNDSSGYFFKKLFKQVKRNVRSAIKASNRGMRFIGRNEHLNMRMQGLARFFGGPAGCAYYSARMNYAFTEDVGSAMRSGRISGGVLPYQQPLAKLILQVVRWIP